MIDKKDQQPKTKKKKKIKDDDVLNTLPDSIRLFAPLESRFPLLAISTVTVPLKSLLGPIEAPCTLFVERLAKTSPAFHFLPSASSWLRFQPPS